MHIKNKLLLLFLIGIGLANLNVKADNIKVDSILTIFSSDSSSSRIQYKYDQSGNILDYAVYNWNVASSSWVGQSHYEKNYNVNSQTGYHVEIYDSKGELVQKFKKMSADIDFEVNISEAAGGIYIVGAFNREKSVQTRIIKK